MNNSFTKFNYYLIAATLIILTACHKSRNSNPAPAPVNSNPPLPATGSQWVHINALPSDSITAFEIINNVIYAYAATSGKIYESADSGANWSSTNPIGTGIHISAITVFNGKILAGNYSSGDNGKTWAKEAYPIGAVTSFAKWNNELYCSSYDNFGKGVLKLNTANNKWETALTANLGNTSVSRLMVVNNYFAAATSDFFALYDPTQQAWHTKDYLDISKARYKNARFPNYVIDMVYDQSSVLAQVYVGNNDQQSILRSNDQGATFSPDTVGVKAEAIDDGKYLMSGLLLGSTKTYSIINQHKGAIGIWIQHRDNGVPAGTSWAKDEEFLSGRYAYAIRQFNNTLFLATNNGLYYKTL